MTADRSEAGVAGPDDGRPDLASAFGDSAAGSLRGLLAPRRAPVRVVQEAGGELADDELIVDELTDDRPEVGDFAGDDREVSDQPVPHVPGTPEAPAELVGTDGSVPDRPADVEEVVPDEPAAVDDIVPADDTPVADRAPTAPVPRPRPSEMGDGDPGPGRRTRSSRERGRRTDAAPRPRRSVRVRDRQSIDLMLLAVARDGAAGGRRFAELVRERSGGAVELDERTLYSELHRLRDKRLIADTGRGSERRYVLTEIGERVLDSRIRGWQAFAGAMDRVLTSDDR